MGTQSPIVLIHGAFQSAATWDLVAPRLRESGRRVIVATLTGLEGDGALSDSVALDTHVQDVVALLEHEDLHDVILVGHSYAGMIITAVAEHAPDRIGRLIYVDALVPEHGQSAMHLLPKATRESFLKLADEGGGWRMRPNDHLLHLWGLDEEGAARTFVKARMCDFTIRCFDQPVDAPTGAANMLPRTYIASVKEDYPVKAVFDPFAARARREGWSYHELPTGHDCQAERPDDLSELLLKAG